MEKIETCRYKDIRIFAFCTMMAVEILLAGGCATTKVVEYKPIFSNTFQERQVPAKITRDDPKTLDNKGYFKLGSVRAFYPMGAGEEKMVQGQLEEILLKEVARQGGDVVSLDVENQPEIKTETVNDGCAETKATVWVSPELPPSV